MDGSDDLLILIMAVGAIWTALVLLHRGKAFWAGGLGSQDQQLAMAVPLFLVIPAGVLLHEVGHALAVWVAGGRVADFTWQVYAGSVTPVGFLQ